MIPIKRALFVVVLGGLALFCRLVAAEEGYSSAVVLQYHHVDLNTPHSTSVAPIQFENHLLWLKENNFRFLSLREIEEKLKKKEKFEHDRNVAITFDDAFVSVCDVAWPILKRLKVPFTVFITTRPLEKKSGVNCSWKNLKSMYESGLMTPANHSHIHDPMTSKVFTKGRELHDWTQANVDEIKKADAIIRENLGVKPTQFAYPFGEYNDDLKAIVADLNLTGYGQQSGALGFNSDFTSLPRIPASGSFAKLETLSTKLLSLPYDATIETNADNPIILDSKQNPPTLSLKPKSERILKSTRCFDGEGRPLPTKIVGEWIEVKPKEKLESGRNRYTCTAPSPEKGRFYWYSHQWAVEKRINY